VAEAQVQRLVKVQVFVLVAVGGVQDIVYFGEVVFVVLQFLGRLCIGVERGGHFQKVLQVEEGFDVGYTGVGAERL